MNKKTLTPIILAGIFFLMLGLSFAAVPLYDLFCRVTGFGGTTQNAENKEIPKIVVNQDYKIRFDTNSNGALDWKFYPEQNTISLKPGEVHTVKFFVENEKERLSPGTKDVFSLSSPSANRVINPYRESNKSLSCGIEILLKLEMLDARWICSIFFWLFASLNISY